MTKTTLERIAEQKTRMEQMENELKRLMQRHKAEERKARTKRLCVRAGLLESMLPDTIPLTDGNFKRFLEKTAANDFGRRALANLTAEQKKQTAAAKSADAAASDSGASASVNAANPADASDRAADAGSAGSASGSGGVTGARPPEARQSAS
jgi:hypothetical protein